LNANFCPLNFFVEVRVGEQGIAIASFSKTRSRPREFV
jgi:hypothetical protein